MYHGAGLGKGGGGGGHGGGGHGGGGGHHGGGGGGGHHGGGGGRRGRPVTNVFVGGGGGGWWDGPGWYGPAIVETCAVTTRSGDCMCKVVLDDGTCVPPSVAAAGLGADDPASVNMTPWIVGGLLVAMAAGAFALEKKGPRPLRR